MAYHSKVLSVVPGLLLVLQPSLTAANRKAGLQAAKAPAHSEQSSVLRAPVMGFLSNLAFPELRPIYGLPGAAMMGAPLPLPAGVVRLSVAPTQDYALVERGDGVEISIMPLAGDAAGQPAPIVGAVAHADRVAFSPDGSKALLYAANLKSLQLVAGLPASPYLARNIDVSWLTQPLTALAASDDGAAVLLGAADDAGGAILSLQSDGAPRQLSRAGNPSSIQFFPHKHDAVVADASGNQVLLITDITGVPATAVLAAESRGIQRPSDLSVSDDGKRVFVVNAGDNSVVSIGVSSGSVQPLRCAFTPSGITRVRRASTFLIMDSATDVPWTLSDEGEPRLTFVPSLLLSVQ